MYLFKISQVNNTCYLVSEALTLRLEININKFSVCNILYYFLTKLDIEIIQDKLIVDV